METLWPAGSLPRPVRRGRRDESVDAADAALMERVAAADRSAMHILFSRHHLAVYRFVLQLVQDKARAEEVTGEVFLDVWRQAPQLRGRSTVLTWILSIARNKTLPHRAKSGPSTSGPSKSGPPHSRLFDGAAAAGERAGCPDAPPPRDRNAALRTCVTKLPPEHREVIDLVYYQEQSMESVAAILGISRSTARTRVFDARQLLADELKKSSVVA
jgi:RNA polymerase sigma-70 factor, ECF subfamily